MLNMSDKREYDRIDVVVKSKKNKFSDEDITN